MTPYELLETVNEVHNDEETIQMLNDFIREIENNHTKYINELDEEKEQFGNLKGRCPLCGVELITISHEEDRGEYQGFSCSETMYEVECSNPECSYTRE